MDEYVKIDREAAIFAFCCECVGNRRDEKEIRLCPSRGKCPLYPFRPFMGKDEHRTLAELEHFKTMRGYHCIPKSMMDKILGSKNTLKAHLDHNHERAKFLPHRKK